MRINEYEKRIRKLAKFVLLFSIKCYNQLLGKALENEVYIGTNQSINSISLFLFPFLITLYKI